MSAGIEKQEWKGDLVLQDTYTDEAVDFENRQPGMDLAKKAFPLIEQKMDDGTTKAWSIPFKSKNKFAVSSFLCAPKSAKAGAAHRG